MPIRYSSIVGGSGSAGFNLNIGSSGNTTFYFNEPQPAGGYSITSQLSDATLEFYAIAEDGTLAGYTNTKALTATKDFDTMVVYGATNNDLITFEFKETIDPTASGDQDSGAAPFITSISDADLANIDDTTIITGGNFATDVTVTFTGTDSIVRNPKSVVRTDSTQLIVTRPDAFLQDNSPYTLTVSNPGITQSAIRTNTSLITAGGNPTWATASGALTMAMGGQAYSVTLSATDPDGGPITYSLTTGSLPTGLSLNSSTGVISGTPTGDSQTFTIAATDAAGNITNRSFSISVFFPVDATGGTVTTSGNYRIHTFNASGTLTVNTGGLVEYLIVAGGGAGGTGGGGSSVPGAGGGAGGYISGDTTLNAGEYAVTIGAGGNGVATSSNISGNNGSNSTFNSLTAIGGGGGATRISPGMSIGGSGGSGGGGGYTAETPNGAFGLGLQPSSSSGGFGNNGGSGGTPANYSGGGGGAGAAGASYNNGGHGGSGKQWVNGTYYAGGGGRGPGDGGPAGSGGQGGGGDGLNAAQSENGGQNLGGGGGGGRAAALGTATSGSGGSGIVIIRYLI